jgi:hypothetical protein
MPPNFQRQVSSIDDTHTKPPRTVNERGEQNLQHYLEKMGLPLGLLTTISEEVYTAMDSRIWVVENSNAMAKRDSHTMKVAPNFECIEKNDGESRWNELSQVRDVLEIEMRLRIIETSSTPPLPSRICFSRFANLVQPHVFRYTSTVHSIPR